MFNGIKVNIRGEREGSTTYNAVLDRLRGSIQQFLNAQQQQARLSGNPQYMTRASFDGAYVVYSNNNGVEYLDIQVAAPSSKDDTTPSPDGTEEYWKWAIIEVRVPGLTQTSGQFSAFMNPPPKSTKGQIGVAWDQRFAFDTPPIIAYPADDVSKQIVDFPSTIQVSSLRVDLRPYPGGVKFDLYAYISRYIDRYDPGPVTAPIVYAASKAANGQSPSGTLFSGGSGSALPNTWPDPSQVGARTFAQRYRFRTLTDVQADFPELISPAPSSGALDTLSAADPVFSNTGGGYNGSFITWGVNPMPTGFNQAAVIAAAGGLFTETTTFNADGLTYKVRGIGAMDYRSTNTDGTGARVALNGAGPSQAHGAYGITCWDYTHYFVGIHPLVAHYALAPTDAPVSFAVMDDMADSYTGRYYAGAFYSSQWESAKTYPRRWPFKDFPQIAHIPSYADPVDTSVANHFGQQKIGTIIINPKKGKGGIKFVAI